LGRMGQIYDRDSGTEERRSPFWGEMRWNGLDGCVITYFIPYSVSTNSFAGALVRGSGITESNGATSKLKIGGQLLSDDEILGNAFVFILAGHETTANS